MKLEIIEAAVARFIERWGFEHHLDYDLVEDLCFQIRSGTWRRLDVPMGWRGGNVHAQRSENAHSD